ncbi:MAG: hypothetical protein LBF65_00220 [Holosporales bacterium]|jgi:hypothetical protein|nr:hypothetical protein [Holosporales bacterium]
MFKKIIFAVLCVMGLSQARARLSLEDYALKTQEGQNLYKMGCTPGDRMPVHESVNTIEQLARLAVDGRLRTDPNSGFKRNPYKMNECGVLTVNAKHSLLTGQPLLPGQKLTEANGNYLVLIDVLPTMV